LKSRDDGDLYENRPHMILIIVIPNLEQNCSFLMNHRVHQFKTLSVDYR